MIILNFSHPITSDQLESINNLASNRIGRIIEIKTQFDIAKPFDEQARTAVESISLSSEEWQTEKILVNLPSFNAIAALVLAELHGRMGYFPAVFRLRPVAESMPPQFEVAEILNLQAVRDDARNKR